MTLFLYQILYICTIYQRVLPRIHDSIVLTVVNSPPGHKDKEVVTSWRPPAIPPIAHDRNVVIIYTFYTWVIPGLA